MVKVQLCLLSLGAALVPVATANCITMDALKENMPQWVDKVPYSHLVNKSWGYPTDCSGFVSWALQTGRDIKAFEYASSAYSSTITIDDLRFGDIVTHVFSSNTDKCKKKTENDDESNLEIFGPELSGHVFFFDRWDDDEHSMFWAYESTEKANQTAACLAQVNPLTRSACLNHHVLKGRKTIEKYSKDNCTSTKYGIVTGGPKRISEALLCPS